MTEYWITYTVTVDAQDAEQALDIARDILRAAKTTEWKVRDVEIVEVVDTQVGS